MNKKGFGVCTIIITFYNSEKTLRYCVKSVLNQSYGNLEIILVDDGSYDKSFEICKQFAEKDKRIKLIHQINKGVSSARNTGLKNAHGEFVYFLDSDDFIHSRTIEMLINGLEKSNSNLCIGGYKTLNLNEYLNNQKVEKEFADPSLCSFSSLSIKDFLNVLLLKDKVELSSIYGGYVWNKLFSRALIQDVFFDEELRFKEDEFFNLTLLFKKIHSIKICYTTFPFYFYVLNEGQVTNTSSYSKLFRETSKCIALFNSNWKEFTTYRGVLSEGLLNNCFILIQQAVKENDRKNFSEAKKILISFSKNINKKEISYKEKIKVVLYQSFIITKLILKIKHKI